jgi:hypothetical protein
MTTQNSQDVVCTVTATTNTTGNVTITVNKGSTLSVGMVFLPTGTAFGGLSSNLGTAYYIWGLSGTFPTYTATLRYYDIGTASAGVANDSGVVSSTALATFVGTGSMTFTSSQAANLPPPDASISTAHNHTINFGLKAVTGTGSIDFRVKYVDLLLASKNALSTATYAFAAQVTTSIAKGTSVSFTVNTTGVTTGTVLYYTVFNVGLTGAVPANQTGTFTLGTNTATFSVTIADNGFYDGGGKFVLQVRVSSYTGAVVATSAVITVTEPVATSVPTITFGTIATTINEGSSGTFNVNTTRLRNGTIINYNINTLISTDVSILTGTFVINANTGSFIVSPESDALVEGNKTFTITASNTAIYSGLTVNSGSVLLVNVLPTFAFSMYYNSSLLSPFPTSVNEGSLYQVTVTTTRIPDGSLLTWIINNTSATSAADWDYPTSGSGVVYNNTISFVIKPKADFLTEPTAESFTISVSCLTITTTSNSITITDTSINPTFSASGPIFGITEDQTIQYNIQDMTGPASAQYMWKITPITPANSTDFLAIQGLFTTYNNFADITITTKPSTLINAGKTFTLGIYDSTGITLYTTLGTFAINDLYGVSSIEILLPEGANIAEGKTLIVPIICTWVVPASTYYWSLEPSVAITGTDLNDFNPAVIYGSFIASSLQVINPGVYNTSFISNFGVSIYADYLTEGIEGFVIKITTAANGAGTVVATSKLISILDTTTGTGASASFTLVPTSIDEGYIGSFTISTSQLPINYSELYWTINHITTNDADFGAISGPITISGTTGSFNVEAIVDSVSEGGETFTVSIRNGGITAPVIGTSSSVTTINNVLPQIAFITSGTTNWTVPSGVKTICAVTIGGGGAGTGGSTTASSTGGGGGALAYVNNITVTPGEILTVVVGTGGTGGAGQSGGASSIARGATILVKANGGGGAVINSSTWNNGGTVAVGTGGVGGNGGGSNTPSGTSGGGGGAGGYAGAGGNGGGTSAVSAGSGGGGGGGGLGSVTVSPAGGGGTGILGQGTNGAAATAGAPGGGGGSGGGSGATSSTINGSPAGGNGANYGGGGGGGRLTTSGTSLGGDGYRGAVRIIWGSGRAFPSTNTGDL